MDWDKDYDVKEYRPKRKRIIGADGRELPALNALTRPDAPYEAPYNELYNAAPLTGAAAMQTSEILDFAEGK